MKYPISLVVQKIVDEYLNTNDDIPYSLSDKDTSDLHELMVRCDSCNYWVSPHPTKQIGIETICDECI